MLRSTSKALAGSRSNGSYHVLRTVGLLYTTCHRRNYHVNKAEHLKDLNSAQLRAVTFPPNTSLQILAGPGTGKTRVLTSRVVELIRKHNLPPSSIHAVTFTRKAAFEMRDRLERHLGSGITDQIGVGTFHSICTRYLKEYGAYVNLPQDFLIWDEDQCVLLVWYLAQRYQPNITLKAAAEINRNLASAKAFLGDSPREVFLDRCSWDTRDWMGKLFDDYQKALKASNALDFEDLQRICFDLYNKVPWIKRLSDLRHVLVDEFQDTSSRQYLLIQKLFRASKGCVTVVGDPDQSLYAWRNADPMNWKKMQRDLPGTHEILLEENYRSTASILAASHAIIKQDPNRPEKSLYTSHTPRGPRPLLKAFWNTAEESEFIASEVKRLVKTSNGLFTYGDFAILNIDNYPSPELQRAFKAEGIPIRILPEPSIWDVPEVNILLAHLHVAMNTGNTPMLCRALNGPYGFDKEAIANLTARGIDENQLPFDVLEKICNGDASDIIPAIKQKGHPFVRVVRSLETLISEGLSPAKLLQYIRTAVNYDDFLDRRSPKWSYLHKQNVDSFIVYAKKCTKNVKASSVRGFLKLIFSTPRVNNIDVGEVSILTCHSSKGLEWPVVFIPEVNDGTHPHHKTSDLDDARRLLYVACTRAQCLLYLTTLQEKMIGRGDNRERLVLYPSEFVEKVDPTLFTDQAPQLQEQDLHLFRKILGERVRLRELEPTD